MLAAPNRLRESADFGTTVRRGRRAGGPLLVVHLLVPAGQAAGAPAGSGTGAVGDPPARVGLVVSRAVGPAVVRNRVKRRLRHLARERVAALPAGSLLVLRAQPAAAGAAWAELGAELDRCLGRVVKP